MQFGGALGRAEHGGRIHVQLGAIIVCWIMDRWYEDLLERLGAFYGYQ
jgi:hypothetical protein